MTEPTLGQVLWRALGGTEPLPLDERWAERYEGAAKAVAEAYEARRTEGCGWLVRNEDDEFLTDFRPGAQVFGNRSDAFVFDSKEGAREQARVFADECGCVVIRVNRRRQP